MKGLCPHRRNRRHRRRVPVASPDLRAQTAPAPIEKNWKAPGHRMLAQALADEVMATHPELLSVTFQGNPPGQSAIFTMFAGSFPERIGKASSEDDIMVVKKGVTIVDPRWQESDTPKKFNVLLPLRDMGGANVGVMVLAYKADGSKSERDFYDLATALRNSVQPRIPSHAALFDPAK